MVDALRTIDGDSNPAVTAAKMCEVDRVAIDTGDPLFAANSITQVRYGCTDSEGTYVQPFGDAWRLLQQAECRSRLCSVTS